MSEETKFNVIVLNREHQRGIHIYHNLDETRVYLARTRWNIEFTAEGLHIFKAPDEA